MTCLVSIPSQPVLHSLLFWILVILLPGPLPLYSSLNHNPNKGSMWTLLSFSHIAVKGKEATYILCGQVDFSFCLDAHSMLVFSRQWKSSVFYLLSFSGESAKDCGGKNGRVGWPVGVRILVRTTVVEKKREYAMEHLTICIFPSSQQLVVFSPSFSLVLLVL